MHLQFFHIFVPIKSVRRSKPKTSPEAAIGGGIGPLDVALESVTTAGVGVLSRTPTDPSQFLIFVRFRVCYEVVPLIQHPVLGPPQRCTPNPGCPQKSATTTTHVPLLPSTESCLTS